MGLEAVCRCVVDGVDAQAKVLLEATELILRAPFRRTFPIAALTDVTVARSALRFGANGSTVTLELGEEAAAKWAKKIATPPPSLAAKLGIDHATPAFLIGEVDEPALIEALDGHSAEPPVAKLSLAVVRDAAQLEATLSRHEAMMGRATLWIVHGKGPSATFGEAPVRREMRARGYRDTKVSAVSATLSATRYSPG